MEPLIQINAIGAPLRLANVNTDQLFPARFIKKPRAVGYAQYLFHDIRRTDAGDIDPNFSLNDPKFETAQILFAGANFGSGSSRERARCMHFMTPGFEPSSRQASVKYLRQTASKMVSLPPDCIKRRSNRFTRHWTSLKSRKSRSTSIRKVLHYRPAR